MRKRPILDFSDAAEKRLPTVQTVLLAAFAVVFALAGLLVGLDETSFDPQEDSDFLINSRKDVRRRDAVRTAVDALAATGEEEATQTARDSDFDYFVLFRSEDSEDILQPRKLEEVQKVLLRIVQDPNYKDFCLRNETGGACHPPEGVVALPPAVSSRFSPFGSPQIRPADDVDTVQMVVSQYADQNASEAMANQRSLFFGNDLAQSPEDGQWRTRFLRVYIPGGLPLTGFRSATDRTMEQEAKVVEMIEGIVDDINRDRFQQRHPPAGVEAIFFGSRVLQSEFEARAIGDLVWATGSVIFVFFYLWFHTTSAFVGGLGLLQILCSLPLALFLYRIVIGIPFFQSLHSLSVFIILGVGADNIFLFVDAHNQAPVSPDDRSLSTLAERMHYTFNRAAKAALVTSFTTMSAFLATGGSEIMPISTFGYFSAILVAANYFLGVLVIPSVLSVWEQSIRPKEQNLWRRGVRCGPRNESSEDSTAQGDADVETATPSPQGRSAFFTPFTGEASGVAAPETPGAQLAPTPNATLEARSEEAREGDESAKGYNITEADPRTQRMTERFFHDRWVCWMDRAKYGVIVAFLCLIGVAAFGATRLQPLSEREQWFPDDHFVQQASDMLENDFGQSERDSTVEVKIVWGVLGVDRTGTSKFRPSERGTPIFDEQFDPSSPQAQEDLLETCRLAAAEDGVRHLTSCWVDDFRDFVGQGAFPVTAAPGESQDEEFLRRIEEFTTQSPVGERHRAAARIGINADGEFILSQIGIQTTLETYRSYSVNKPVYDQWESFVEQTERALVNNALQGMAISITVAFAVLVISTRNFIVGFFATLSIAGIVSCVLAAAALMGWEFDTTTSVSSVILIGFSVDYTVHIANAYVESKKPTAFERTREALTEMAISIIAGAGTTFGAGLFLFGATITFFGKFGTLILLSIGLSLTFSLVFFTSTLLVFGPDGDAGSIFHIVDWMRALCGLCRPGANNKREDDKQEIEMAY